MKLLTKILAAFSGKRQCSGSVADPVDVSNIIQIQLRPWRGRFVRAPKHFFAQLAIGRGHIAFKHRFKIAWMMTILMLKPNAAGQGREAYHAPACSASGLEVDHE